MIYIFSYPVKLKVFYLGLACLMIFCSCAGTDSKEEKTADELISAGLDYFDSQKFRKAIDEFEQLKDWYPFSKYAILAELKTADAYFNLEEYDDAIFAYEEFEQLHPRNEAVPYVLYQIGMSYFNRIGTVDREQTAAKNALENFNKLIARFPDNEYSLKAGTNLQKCYESRAGHDFYVGCFYFKSKHYKAAFARFKAVINNYPKVAVQSRALPYLKQCEALLQQQTTVKQE